MTSVIPNTTQPNADFAIVNHVFCGPKSVSELMISELLEDNEIIRNTCA